MTQPIISQQELVEVVRVEGVLLFGKVPLPWLERSVPIKEGFSQEVFREKTYLGSVSSSTPQLIKVRRGDVIYCISFAALPSSFKGMVATTDGYRRTYEVYFELAVRDSKRYTEQYRSGIDLINSAINMFRRGFERFLQQYTYDQIDHVEIKIDSFNKRLRDEYGLIVMNLSCGFQADARRTGEIEVQQKAERRRREIDAEVTARKHELQRQAELRNLEEKIKREQESPKAI